jgi:macrolide-specific efflux system membrane fusion protein
MINKIIRLIGTIKGFAAKHKIISILAVVIILGGGYWWYQSAKSTGGINHYVLAEATSGTVITSVAGTGQISASDQIDIKPEVSGKIVYLNIPKGSDVKEGTLLAQIESRDALKAVQSAENDLQGAQLSTQDISGAAKDDLDLSYSNGLDALTTTLGDLTSMKSDLDNIFLQSSYNGSDSDINYYLNFVNFYDDKNKDTSFWTVDAKKKYSDMQKEIDSVELTGWAINKNSQSAQIDNSINDTYVATKTFLDLIRQTSNLVQRYQKISATQSLTTPIKTATTTTQMTQLSSSLALLVKDVNALSAAKADILAKKEAFSKIGVNTQSQNLNIQQYKNALANAKDNLAKYYIYAPIDGTISASDSTIRVGDTVSSGTLLGSIITQKKIIGISLNEVDAVKIKKGQKATIAFDALPTLSATGSVIDIDSVGTVSQGVVSYGAKIALDIMDTQIKSGMSGSVNVITETKQNVLTVPNSAVKSKSGNYYVLVLSQKQDLTSPTASQGFLSEIAPIQKTVEIGIADDINTEIISGLSEGDQVVSRTISGVKTSASNTSTGGVNGATRTLFTAGGGGGVRPGN